MSSKQREAEFGLCFTALHGTSLIAVLQTQFFLLQMPFFITLLALLVETPSLQRKVAPGCHNWLPLLVHHSFHFFPGPLLSSFCICWLLFNAFALFGAHSSACANVPRL